MDHFEAVLIPADPDRDIEVVLYRKPEQLLDVLYEMIGCDCVDKTPRLTTQSGDEFRVWVDDVGLRPAEGEIEHNDRAIALCRSVGYEIPDVGGNAVVTGGDDVEGWTETVPPRLRDQILAVLKF